MVKKLLYSIASAALVSALFVTPVSAHGHHRQAAPALDTSCPVCTVEGCTEEGRHTHDGHDYCGYEHESGYCDGTCTSAATTTTTTARSRHHGGHHGRCH